MRQIAVALILIFGSVCHSYAQQTRGTQPLTEGRQYMIAYPFMSSEDGEKPKDPSMVLMISSRVQCRGVITTPAQNNSNVHINREFNLSPNITLVVKIDSSYMNRTSGEKEGFGIWVNATQPITVRTFQSWQGSGEMATHLPTNCWGKEYRTFNFFLDRFGMEHEYFYRPAQTVVVAATDSTHISVRTKIRMVTSSTFTQVPDPSSEYFVYGATLNRGETLMFTPEQEISKVKDWSSDPTGTLVTSDKPIGVVSGHCEAGVLRVPDVLPQFSHFPKFGTYIRSNIHDVMLPAEYGGTEFVTVPFMYTQLRKTGQSDLDYRFDDDKGDVVRIVAMHDGTVVSRKKENESAFDVIDTINTGEWYQDSSQQAPSVYRTSVPAMCGMYGKSWVDVKALGSPVPGGMPSLSMVPPSDRGVSSTTFRSPAGLDNFLNIVFKQGDASKIRVDGNRLDLLFVANLGSITGTNYQYVRAPIAAGDHVVQSEHDSIRFSVISYGSLDGLAYGQAYATPTSLELSVPCPDSVLMTVAETSCGVWNGSAFMQENGRGCGVLHDANVVQSSNADVNVIIEDNRTRATIDAKVLDLKLPATATVRALARNGSYVEQTFTYTPDSISVSPSQIDLKRVVLGSNICQTVKVVNNTNVKLTVADVHSIANRQLFSVVPTVFELLPGQEIELTICSNQLNVGFQTDTLVLAHNLCRPLTITVQALGVSPQVVCYDYTWDVLVGDVWHEQELAIENFTQDDAIILDIEDEAFVGSRFKLVRGFGDALPITIRTGERYSYAVAYNPGDVAGLKDSIEIDVIGPQTVYDDRIILQGSGKLPSSVNDMSSDQSVRVFPHPISAGWNSTFSVSTDAEVTSVTIVDVMGRVVASTVNTLGIVADGSYRSSVLISDFLSVGSYHAVITTERGVTTVPLVCMN